MKVALVHDYLAEYGGAERVVEALHEAFPDAPVYTSFVNPDSLGIHWSRFKDWQIHQSIMTNIPFYKQLFSPLRLWAGYFFEQFNFDEFDVVISSTNMYMAKAIVTRPETVHVCYCHTPSRALYGYSTMSDWKKNWLVKWVGEQINHRMRIQDFFYAQRVNFFIANSKEVQGRIQKFYRRDSVVIHPPVDIPSSSPADGKRGYYLYVNRMAFSKHPELAVQACTNLHLPLKVVGTGKMLAGLKEQAGSIVEFLGSVSDEELQKLYAGAIALIYPVEDEDFGIVPIEAMAHGTPVLAHASGGPLETIIDGKTGVFIHEFTQDAVEEGIEKINQIKWDRKKIYQHSQHFSKQRFIREIQAYVKKVSKPKKEGKNE